MSLLCSSFPSASSLFLHASETQMKGMLYVDLSKVKEASLSDQISGPLCSSPLKHWPSHSSRLLSWEREEQKCLGRGTGKGLCIWFLEKVGICRPVFLSGMWHPCRPVQSL